MSDGEKEEATYVSWFVTHEDSIRIMVIIADHSSARFWPAEPSLTGAKPDLTRRLTPPGIHRPFDSAACTWCKTLNSSTLPAGDQALSLTLMGETKGVHLRMSFLLHRVWGLIATPFWLQHHTEFSPENAGATRLA